MPWFALSATYHTVEEGDLALWDGTARDWMGLGLVLNYLKRYPWSEGVLASRKRFSGFCLIHSRNPDVFFLEGRCVDSILALILSRGEALLHFHVRQ